MSPVKNIAAIEKTREQIRLETTKTFQFSSNGTFFTFLSDYTSERQETELFTFVCVKPKPKQLLDQSQQTKKVQWANQNSR